MIIAVRNMDIRIKSSLIRPDMPIIFCHVALTDIVIQYCERKKVAHSAEDSVKARLLTPRR